MENLRKFCKKYENVPTRHVKFSASYIKLDKICTNITGILNIHHGSLAQ